MLGGLSRSLPATLVLSCLSAGAPSAAAQTPAPARAVPDTITLTAPDCPSCRIELTRVVTIGDTAGPGRLGSSLTAIARDGRGRYLVATDLADGFTIYDAAGRRRQRVTIRVPPGWKGVTSAAAAPDSVAARGAGAPRENGTAAASRQGPTAPAKAAVTLVALSAGDTVHVLDGDNRMHVVLAPAGETYVVARRRPLPLDAGTLWNALLLPGDELLVPGNVGTREHVGYPLHVVAADGRIRSSFGADVARWVPGEEHSSGARRLAWADSGRFWMAWPTRYQLERWTLDGRRELTLRRPAPWFTPSTELRRITPDSAPQPWLLDVWQDGAGRVWTLVGVADKEWRSTLRTVSRPGRSDAYVPEDAERLFDTVVEVFDPACGRLLASKRLPSFLLQKIDGDHVAGWRTSRTGAPQLDVWRVELSHPETEVGSCSPASSRTPRSSVPPRSP